ncbi:MAG: tetratricopeptide repeat protein [Treponema sp.]|nr:tetratricopeptide repeat protein [Treponema sp.]
MAAAKKAKTDKSGIGDKVNELIQKNRKPLVFTLMGIIAAVIILIAYFSIRDSVVSKAFSKIDEFDRRYQAITAETADTQDQQNARSQEIGALMDELTQFEKKNSGYAAARAYAISASIYEAQADWASVENAWVSAASAAPKTYFAPVAYFNAATAAEQQGNNERAIELYTKAVDFGVQFPAAPRAQFSIGRIYESMGNTNAALAAYQALVGQGSQDQIWVNLAHNRILVLTMGI